jgi:hypothetical protein
VLRTSTCLAAIERARLRHREIDAAFDWPHTR